MLLDIVVLKTYNQLKNSYYWENLKLDIQEYLDNCIMCFQYCPLPKSFSYETNKVSSPFHNVSIDVVGPLPRTFHSNQYIIVAINHFTKWIGALAVRDTTVILQLYLSIII